VFFVEAAGAEWFRADGWLKGHDPGRWFGLRTDAHLGMLARIELPSNNLTGEVSGLPCCLLPAAYTAYQRIILLLLLRTGEVRCVRCSPWPWP
jgi:hypothetical protein